MSTNLQTAWENTQMTENMQHGVLLTIENYCQFNRLKLAKFIIEFMYASNLSIKRYKYRKIKQILSYLAALKYSFH